MDNLTVLSEKISILCPKDGDIITVTLDYQKYDARQMQQIAQGLQETFKNNKVVILPVGIELKLEQKEEIIEYIQNL
jgi:hypothetical protein